MTGQRNTRRHERFSAEGVRGQFSYSVQAHVLNISIGGFAVRTHTQLNIGRKYRFELGADDNAVQLTGVVRWCRMSGTERREAGDIVPVYEAGIAFEEILSEKADELFEFMERNVVVDVKRRIFGRFRVRDEDLVTLESDSEFQVKQLSISGMMIESDVALKPDTLFDLEMRLGEYDFITPARIIYMAEINLQDEALHYRLGVEFLRTAPASRKVLEDFIRSELQPID